MILIDHFLGTVPTLETAIVKVLERVNCSLEYSTDEIEMTDMDARSFINWN